MYGVYVWYLIIIIFFMYLVNYVCMLSHDCLVSYVCMLCMCAYRIIIIMYVVSYVCMHISSSSMIIIMYLVSYVCISMHISSSSSSSWCIKLCLYGMCMYAYLFHLNLDEKEQRCSLSFSSSHAEESFKEDDGKGVYERCFRTLSVFMHFSLSETQFAFPLFSCILFLFMLCFLLCFHGVH